MNRVIRGTWLALFVLAAAGCSPFAVQGSGNSVIETREVPPSSAVFLSGIGDLSVVQGDSPTLSIEAEENFLPLIKTRVQDGILSIGLDTPWMGTILPSRPIRYRLTVKDLTALTLSGAANIRASSLKCDHLSLVLSGAGNIRFDQLTADEIRADLSGAGNIELEGQTSQQIVNLTGMGQYNAPYLNSRNAQIRLMGAGSAVLWVQDALDVTIGGVGSVKYYGTPRVTRTLTGLGNVTGLGMR